MGAIASGIEYQILHPVLRSRTPHVTPPYRNARRQASRMLRRTMAADWAKVVAGSLLTVVLMHYKDEILGKSQHAIQLNAKQGTPAPCPACEKSAAAVAQSQSFEQWAKAQHAKHTPLDNDNSYLFAIRAICPPQAGPRLVLEVGGNKGYAIPRYGFLWGNLDFATVRNHIKHLQDRTHMWADNQLTLHVFEPTKSAIDVLNALKTAMPFLPMTLNHVGVSDKDGTATFHTPYANVGDEGATIGPNKHGNAGPVEEVKLVQLDTFYQQHLASSFPQIAYIKVDVEGHDTHVVRGMMNNLLKNERVMAFEFEVGHQVADEVHKLVDQLLEYNYGCYVLRHNSFGMTRFVSISGNHWDDAAYKATGRQNIVCLHMKAPCFGSFQSSFVDRYFDD